MKNEWQEKPVGEIIRLEYGKPLDDSERKPDGRFPVYGANGEKDRTDRSYYDKPSIIVGRKGSAGEINLTENKFWPLDVTYFVTFDERQYDLRFLFYLLTTLELTKLAKGVKPGINRNEVYSQVTRVPRLPEQQRIVGLLDEAFEGIATAKGNAEKNLQNARALFESQLQSVFSERSKGWVEATVGETCTLKSGTTVSPSLEKPAGDIPYLKVADMTFGGNEDQITTSSRFLSKSDVKKSAIIPRGATIFPKRGGAILTNKKRITSLPICADLNIMAVIPSSQIEADLLYFYFLSVDMRKLGTGSSIPQINNYDVAPLVIEFPKAIGEQRKIVGRLRELRAESERLASIYERKLAALDALRKSLLHQAFTGQLTATI
jgi:type I restriction enzyme, S subunit